jgi:alpha-L-rhamnosidase
MKKIFQFFLIIAVWQLSVCQIFASGSVFPSDLKTEWLANPHGVDILNPGLSWLLNSAGRNEKQIAYQVLVASSEAALATDIGDMWNSGRVISDEQNNIVYKGTSLISGRRYYWKVKVWDGNNRASEWSPAAWWETGLLKEADWQGKWIGTKGEKSAPLFRKEFSVSKPIARATAYVYGLGWYEIHLNGLKVGDRVLTPANTDYSKINLYDSYDVTPYLKKGGNAVGLWLGNGYGTTYSKYGWRWMLSKRAVLQMNIEFTDGSTINVVTDETWRAADSQILSADIYNGESYDATKEKTGWDVYGYNDGNWEQAVISSPPPGKIKSNMSVPVKVVKIIRPQSVNKVAPGSYVFDLGQNIAGWTRLHVTGAHRGNKITMRHAEAINDNGSLNTFTNRDAEATDTYICKGGNGSEIYEPRFTYHGFRYVEVNGYPGTPDLSDVEGCAVHSDVEFTGSFSCSDSLLNKIHSNFQWTMLNNMVSIVTDNPVRDERTPCQMDENCVYEAAIQNFDVQQYFKNWLNDIYGSTSNPDWSAGQVLGPWLLYQYYGDERILENFYSSSKREVDYCIENAESSRYWVDSFGDWCPPFTDGTYARSFSEGEIVNTCLYFRITELMSRIAGILGKDSDSKFYSDVAKSIRTSFNKRFLNESANLYGSGKQITFIMPLLCGLVPDDRETRVYENLVKNVTESCKGHFGSGIYGTSFLPDLLSDYDGADIAYMLFSQTTYPSFGDHIINHGATTTWEQWGVITTEKEMETYDHAMFSGADKTFYTRFGGIRPLTPGYRTISFRPYLPGKLSFVRSSVKTVKGLIVSEWKKDGNIYTHHITVPVNTTAIVSIPGSDPGEVYENGIAVLKSEGIRYLRTEKNYLVYEVGSGSYYFSYGMPVK